MGLDGLPSHDSAVAGIEDNEAVLAFFKGRTISLTVFCVVALIAVLTVSAEVDIIEREDDEAVEADFTEE